MGGKGKGKKSKQEPGEERPAKRVKKEKSMKVERYEAHKEQSNILPTDENETDKEQNNILRPEGSEVNNQPEEGSGREGVSESEPEATVINLNRNEYEEQLESAEEREARNSEVNFEATVFTRHSVKEQGVEQPLRVKVKKEKSLAKSLARSIYKEKEKKNKKEKKEFEWRTRKDGTQYMFFFPKATTVDLSSDDSSAGAKTLTKKIPVLRTDFWGSRWSGSSNSRSLGSC